MSVSSSCFSSTRTGCFESPSKAPRRPYIPTSEKRPIIRNHEPSNLLIQDESPGDEGFGNDWVNIEKADDGFLTIQILYLVNIESERRIYCVLNLGEQRAVTSIVNEDYSWNESFSFICFQGDDRLLKIQIFEGYDEKTKYIGDSLIGECVRYIHTTQPWKKTYWQNVMLSLPVDSKFPNPGMIKLSLRFVPAESNVADPVDQHVILDKYGFNIGDRSVTFDSLQEALKFESKPIRLDWQQAKSKTSKLQRQAEKGVAWPYKAMFWELYCKKFVPLSDQLFEDDAYEATFKTEKNSVLEMYIDYDIPRTFPEHAAFKLHEGKAALKRVVVAVSYWNPAIGYCQSMANIIALLLLLTDEERAFRLAVILIHYIMPDYYSNNMIGLQVDMVVFTKLFAKYLPGLLKHFVSIKVDLVLLINSWLLNLFSCSFPLNTVYRLWDILFCQGSQGILGITLGIFRLYEKKLMELSDFLEINSLVVTQNALLYNSEQLIQIIEDFAINPKEIDILRKKATFIVVENHQERELQKISQNQLTINQILNLKNMCFSLHSSFKVPKLLFLDCFELFRKKYMCNNLDVDFNEHLFSVFKLEVDGFIDIREYCICIASSAPFHGLQNKIFLLFALFNKIPTTGADMGDDVPGFIRFKDIKLMIYWQYKAHHLPLSSAEKLETLSDFAWAKRPFDYKLTWTDFRETCVAQPFTFML